jgi:hypothetical protein
MCYYFQGTLYDMMPNARAAAAVTATGLTPGFQIDNLGIPVMLRKRRVLDGMTTEQDYLVRNLPPPPPRLPPCPGCWSPCGTSRRTPWPSGRISSRSSSGMKPSFPPKTFDRLWYPEDVLTCLLSSLDEQKDVG